MVITPSGKNYMQAIYCLGGHAGYQVRPVDVAGYLGVSRPSVNRALKYLQKGGIIHITSHGAARFTEKGIRTAKSILARYRTIKIFLETTLDAGGQSVERDAWAIEHVISNQAVYQMGRFLKETANTEKYQCASYRIT